MPASIRQQAQRKLDACVNSQQRAIQHLEELAEQYDELHPDISQPMTAIQVLLMECITLTEHLKGIF